MRWPLRQSNILQCGAEAEHHRMCLAAGSSEKVAEDGSAARDPHEVFRVFYDSACEKKSLVTFEGETGVHLCLCHVVLSKLASPQESVKKKDMPFYTWVESKCPRGAKKERGNLGLIWMSLRKRPNVGGSRIHGSS
eukprot:g30025.t2